VLEPTPVGVVLERAVLDRLPVEPVAGTWLTIDAR
jgi:hypothetical protein